MDWQMDIIWAPWRMTYIESPKHEGCILCQKPAEKDDAESLVLYRGRHNFILLNLFPYNPGHLMVAPYRHLARLEDFSEAELLEHFNLVRKSTTLLHEVLMPSGFNIGINISRIAGAGIEDHLHTHIVPRWQGDANFMPVTANAKVMPESLETTYRKLKAKLS